MGRLGIAAVAAALACGSPGRAQDATSVIPTRAAGESPAPARPEARLWLLKRDTPLDLIATREINSSQAKVGDQFTLAVNTPLKDGETVVIPFMTKAVGEVTSAQKAGGLGRNGEMSAHLLYLTLGDARIPISGEVSNAGGGAGSAAVVVALSGLVGLFHRGNDGRIKAGQRVAAFVGEDVWLDLAASPVKRVEVKMVPVVADAPSAQVAPADPGGSAK